MEGREREREREREDGKTVKRNFWRWREISTFRRVEERFVVSRVVGNIYFCISL